MRQWGISVQGYLIMVAGINFLSAAFFALTTAYESHFNQMSMRTMGSFVDPEKEGADSGSDTMNRKKSNMRYQLHL